MTRHLLALCSALLLVATLLAAWVVWRGRDDMSPQTQIPAQTPGELGTFSIYTNGEYGFSVMYPNSAIIDETFDQAYFLPSVWRMNALPTATGTPVLAIVTFVTESDHSYPRHFSSQVRIGASADPKEVARCEERATEQGEVELPDVTINGTAFKAFSFQDAGMMKYVRGVSYRTVHEGACIAMEAIESGSSYRDDPESSDDIPDEELQAHYDNLQQVVQSFSFARI
ncbi:hypothetical protein KKH15_02550 [Patescibacteria group bacterium]|nr:hypothetical protein [Patescibacteria group bacterium]MBU1754704.1 hypothetical protein [Patescibacteria group bacterium]